MINEELLCEMTAPGKITAVCGRPAMGKTGFAVDFVRRSSLNTAFFTFDLSGEQIKERFEKLGDVPENLEIIDCKAGDLEKRLKYLEDIQLVVIDYLQLCCDGKGDNFLKRLKKQAEKKGFAVLILSQLSRAIESRRNPVPRLTDIHQEYVIDDADNILLLYREAYYDYTAPRDRATIIVAKHSPYTIETKWDDKGKTWGLCPKAQNLDGAESN